MVWELLLRTLAPVWNALVNKKIVSFKEEDLLEKLWTFVPIEKDTTIKGGRRTGGRGKSQPAAGPEEL